jgi:hypothetical protein
MNNITDKEYLALCEQLLNEQYGGSDDDSIDKIPDSSWIPAVPEIKQKMIAASSQGIVDLTTTKKDKILDAIYKCSNVKVGTFSLKISTYRGLPGTKGMGNLGASMDFSLMEERLKTPSGRPCRMTYRVKITEDKRFHGRPWLKYFVVDGYASRMPVETIVEFIRWLQVMQKLPAFL